MKRIKTKGALTYRITEYWSAMRNSRIRQYTKRGQFAGEDIMIDFSNKLVCNYNMSRRQIIKEGLKNG